MARSYGVSPKHARGSPPLHEPARPSKRRAFSKYTCFSTSSGKCSPRSGGVPTDVPSLIHALVRAGMHTPSPKGEKLHKFLVDGVERELIEEVLRELGGNQVKAAERLGINRNTLHKKREEYRKADSGSTEPPATEPPAEPPASAAG